MLKRQQYDVQFDDGRIVRVAVDGRDYMFYEQESGKNALELISEGNSFNTWYISAAAAMRRQGLFEGTPEEFYAAVSFVLPVTGEGGGDVDPTTPPEVSETS